MTAAVLLAGLAGICAAAAIVELLAHPREPGRRLRGQRRSTRLGAMTVALARVARSRAGVRAPAGLRERLAAAGDPLGLGPSDVMALKAVGALAGLLFAFTLVGLLPGRLGVVAMLCAPAAGFIAPDLVLARRTRARAAQIGHELADVLDLLRVAVQAGLPVGRALAEVGERCQGLLAVELRAAARRMQLGVTRAEAFEQLVARCPSDGVATLTAAVTRADRHGAPLAPALQALVAEARAEQARLLRDDGARAAPKIQLVVALVLVPAVMLLVAAVLVQALG